MDIRKLLPLFLLQTLWVQPTFAEVEVVPVTPDSVYEIASRVADWQIATFETQGDYRALPSHPQPWHNREKHHDLDWTNGALYVGMYQWSQIASTNRYTGWLKTIGERNSWKLHQRPYHADDHTVGQFYLNLYRDSLDWRMLEPTRQQFDWILKNRCTGNTRLDCEPDRCAQSLGLVRRALYGTTRVGAVGEHHPLRKIPQVHG